MHVATQHNTDRLVFDLTRAVVERVAPTELDRFAVTSEAFFENPKGVRRAAKEQMLAFGMPEAAAVLSPVLLVVGQTVVNILAEPAQAAVKQTFTEVVAAAVKRLFRKLDRKPAPQQMMQPLTAEQFEQLDAVIRRTLADYDVPATLHANIANAFIAEAARLPARANAAPPSDQQSSSTSTPA